MIHYMQDRFDARREQVLRELPSDLCDLLESGDMTDMQIVLARLEDAQELVRAGRADLGERHVFRSVKKPVSLMWINQGGENDLVKAERFAQAEGYTVFCYKGERDPLGRARYDIASAR